MQTDWRKGTTRTPRPPSGRPQRLGPDEAPQPGRVRLLQRVVLAGIGLGLAGFGLAALWGG
jgi:hypothetical protein